LEPGSLPSLSSEGAGLVIVEVTVASPKRGTTAACADIWGVVKVEGLSTIAAGIKSAGAVSAIQIGHAGRKTGAALSRKLETI